MQHMRELYENDNLNDPFAHYFEPVRPVEELYDFEK
jgi:hypothetical protein